MVTKTAHTTSTPETVNTVLPDDEAHALFDQQARHILNISGPEFLRRWDAGEYRDLPDTPETHRIMRVAYLIPFGRQQS